MTKEDYEKRLMAAAVRVVVRAEDGYTISASDNLPGAIKELAAILAEKDEQVEEMRQQIEVLTSHAHVHGVKP